jgi:hypothetical protein
MFSNIVGGNAALFLLRAYVQMFARRFAVATSGDSAPVVLQRRDKAAEFMR